jgi:V/A-type H+-transporting ATPase subunit E
VAYEDLLKSVEESAREKELDLRSRAAASVGEIRARGKKQAEEIRQAHLDAARKSITTEQNKLVYLTKAENKELLIRARETAFDQAFSEAAARLQELRSDPAYPAVFEQLLREAAAAFGTEPFVIHIDPRDEALAKKTLARLGLSPEIRADITSSGGMVASLPDNSVVVSNTVESRLQRARELKRREIHTILAGA